MQTKVLVQNDRLLTRMCVPMQYSLVNGRERDVRKYVRAVECVAPIE